MIGREMQKKELAGYECAPKRCEAEQPARESGVFTELDRLDRLISIIEERITVLYNRIDPVVLPFDVRPAPCCDEVKRPQTSRLAEVLKKSNNRLYSISEGLLMTIEGIDV